MFENVEELQQAADYRMIRKRLRPTGIGSIIFGVVALATASADTLGAIFALIGLFLLIEGIWVVARPSVKGLFLEGIALSLIGVWNILVTIADLAAKADTSGRFIIVGLFQIAWGLENFARYKQFAGAKLAKPSPDLLKQLDGLAKSIVSTKPKTEADAIDFQQKDFLVSQNWKGKLLGDTAVFAGTKHQEVLIAKKHDLSLTKRSDFVVGKKVKGTLEVGKRKMAVVMSPESFQKYDTWRSSPS